MRVTYFGTWERGHPRNEQTISALRSAGVDVDLVHVEAWKDEHKFALGPTVLPRLLAAEARLSVARLAHDTDALIVGYPGHFDLPVARLRRRPVVFNPMVSLYDSLVDDRARFRPGSLPARALRELDVRSFRGADVVVADTRANARFMAESPGSTSRRSASSVPRSVCSGAAWRRSEEFHALFVGKLIPLHGLDVILEAARLLPDVRFRVIGSGQLDRLLHDRPSNVEHVPWVEYERLPAGVRDGGLRPRRLRLERQGAAGDPEQGLPGARRRHAACYRRHGGGTRGAHRWPRCAPRRAVPESIADAVRRIRDTPELAEQLSREGRATFEREASEAVLGSPLAQGDRLGDRATGVAVGSSRDPTLLCRSARRPGRGTRLRDLRIRPLRRREAFYGYSRGCGSGAVCGVGVSRGGVRRVDAKPAPASTRSTSVSRRRDAAAITSASAVPSRPASNATRTASRTPSPPGA